MIKPNKKLAQEIAQFEKWKDEFMKTKIYVGIKANNMRTIFKAEIVPTRASHGEKFASVIGPFRTMRGAKFMALFGGGNPHVQHVNDAERIAEKLEKSHSKECIEANDRSPTEICIC